MNDKQKAELKFQKQWAMQFTEHAVHGGARSYWILMRYFTEIQARLAAIDGPTILDVGCGVSTVLHWLEGYLHGVDPLADEYRKIYRYPKTMNIQTAPAEDLPFPDNYFDAVFCSNALDHMDDPAKALSEMARVAAPGSLVFLTCEVFERVVDRATAHPHCLTRDAVIRLCCAAGLRVTTEHLSPWIGLQRFASEGRYSRAHGTDEVVLFMELANS